jgi:hypothetical protein
MSGNKKDVNIIVSSKELNEIRKAIIYMYHNRTDKSLEDTEKLLNSNLKNYLDLYQDIDKKVSLRSINILSTKPLATLFYFSKKNNDEPTSFRKRFINTLYLYSFDQGREEYLKSIALTGISSASKQMENISGYWEVYYDKEDSFLDSINSNVPAYLGIFALIIKGDNINNSKVDYLVKNGKGSGTIEVQGPNLVFKLRNETNNKPIYMFMNCGVNISDYNSHLKSAAGVFMHMNDIGSSKCGKCVMKYFNDIDFENKFGMREIDFNNSSFIDKFSHEFRGELKIDPEHSTNNNINKIKTFFKRDKKNTIDVHVSHFQTSSLDN